ncbi:ATP-binding cassette domain-containing protein [Nocardioides sp. CN2-186]|uniref:ABC transporter permease subunit n=1 Tax=Nocardioides tweenelious TaxID=3156607 RepID=UPI0032B4C27C
MTIGTLVLGLQSGLTIGLLAVGLVLIYKANRFINLAHAQLGAVSALLVAKWVLDEGWNFWLAFALSIVIGIVTGVVVERCLIRPVRRRGGSSLPLLLMSIGASQLLLALCFIPAFKPDPDKAQPYPQPFEAAWSVGGVVLSGMDILTLVLVPVLVVALAVFLRYSRMGREIRAAANNIDAARLCGISVTRVSLVTWGIAGSLSAVAAVLSAPKQASLDVVALGPYLLMLSLGAAAFGAFVSLPWALGGGLVLGMVSRVVAARTSNEATAEVVTFLVILLVVAARSKAIGAAFATGGAGAPERRPVRVPASLQSSRFVRQGPRLGGLLALAAAVVLPFVPGFNGDGDRFLLVIVIVYALVGMSLTVLLGWNGQVSLGQFAIVGIAAFASARLIPHGWTLPALMLMAAVLGGAVMAFVSLPALRAAGFSLAVTTLGLAVVTPDWLLQQDWMAGPESGSGGGLSFAPAPVARGLGLTDSHLSLYFIALVILVAVLLAGNALRRSGSGRLMIAVRDNQRAGNAFGVFAPSVRLSSMILCGAISGIAGVLYADAYGYVAPTQFSAGISIALLAIPVIGGLGSMGGAIAATALVYLPVMFLAPVLISSFERLGLGLGFQLALSSVGIIVMILQFPTGLAGGVQGAWQGILDRLAAKRDGLATTPADADESVAQAVAHQMPESAETARPSRRAGGRVSRRVEALTGLVEADRSLPLRVEGVTWRVGRVTILDDAAIHVGRGEIVGLIGPNGAGKTSLMNVVSGVVSPDAGSVSLFGRPMVDLPADYRAAFGAARSFQDASLFQGLTVTETMQVALNSQYRVSGGASMLRAPWARDAERRSRREAVRILDRFGLTPWANTLTGDLSTGTRRICDLAAQVAVRPRLLLLDEPTGGVSQHDAEAFSPLLRRIRDELDCSILIVEHDMPLLMSLCDRVYAMETGRVITEGTPEEVREHPEVIASYLGSNEVAIKRSGGAHTIPAPDPAPARPPAHLAASTDSASTDTEIRL